MAIEEFSPADMQILMLAIERVCIGLKLTDSEEHLHLKSHVSALIFECADEGERDLEKLIDCAHASLSNGAHDDVSQTNGAPKPRRLTRPQAPHRGSQHPSQERKSGLPRCRPKDLYLADKHPSGNPELIEQHKKIQRRGDQELASAAAPEHQPRKRRHAGDKRAEPEAGSENPDSGSGGGSFPGP